MSWLQKIGPGLLLGSTLALSFSAHGRFYFVDPEGKESNSGYTPLSPLGRVQEAIELATPGDTVVLLPGTYAQDVISVRDGQVDAPIRIQGPPEAILVGAGKNRIVDIRHSHIELAGFTIDGRIKSWWKSRYRDKLIYIKGSRDKALRGIRVLNMKLQNGGGECLRLKAASDNEVAYNTIESCGLHDFKLDHGGKNGEAIYVGTATGQLEDQRPDASSNNHIHHNYIRSAGSECIDIKEGASFNLVEHNVCLDQADPDSGGISVRGGSNVIRYNAIGPSNGAGIHVGSGSKKHGRGNSVYGNLLHNNRAGAIKLRNLDQKLICGNDIRQPEGFPEIRVPAGTEAPVLRACQQPSDSVD